MLPPLALAVPPQICLAAEAPSPYVMVDLLVLVHRSESALSDETSPEAVPVGALRHREASCFESVDYTVVSVGGLAHLEVKSC